MLIKGEYDMGKYKSLKKLSEERGIKEEFLRKLITQNLIKNVSVGGNTLIEEESLDNHFESLSGSTPTQTQTPNGNNSTLLQSANNSNTELIKRIILITEEQGSRAKRRNRYLNIYGKLAASPVYLQLHEPTNDSFKGIFIVVPEAHEADVAPSLTRASITDLKGFHGPNKDWLLGSTYPNGLPVRGTCRRALVLFVPTILLDSSVGQEWKEIHELVEYAYQSRIKRKHNLKD